MQAPKAAADFRRLMSEIEPNAAGPEPEDEEKDASLERRKEEDAQRYPGHEDPKEPTEPGTDSES